jgi:uncharacterized protein YndB with AHSA1/START domain
MRNHRLQIDKGGPVLADRIEREIEIDAPIDVVWAVITEPEHIASWFSDTAQLDLRPGGEGLLVWQLKATNRGATVDIRVERVEPPHFFSFRWDYQDEKNPALVEFSLEANGNATRLRLVESGIQGLDRSEEMKEEYFADHTSGWNRHLEDLRVYAAEQQRSTVTR